ncbi:hypothetical protein LY90DRAFT_510805 [Neocallimastix californiae]|uniref:Ubiquitin-like domain-containing protein n=1 Tax=Neocallimastix californiae TaxID=1754190 RepID=A0A1Y2BWF5_9FUNG|nr:hypothetical protein LY90DRAFT_510805 [Neocallimastix californiae]|eukprot:ORY38977.1 hypothetical protein LY90DRAFT_510805 [Neocallimastix californiae]
MSVIIDGLDNVIIKVRINEQNLKFTIPYNTSVSELKKQIKNTNTELKDKYLRLIYKGKVLKDDKNLSNYGIVAEVESSEDEENENEELKALNNKDSLRQYVIHCAVSDVLENEEHNLEPQIQQRLGFDRLIGLGLSQEEVDVFRRHFHILRNSYDMNTEQGRQLEEEWLNSQRDETGNNNNSLISQYDFLIGLLIGLFGGLISLLFVQSISKKKIFE